MLSWAVSKQRQPSIYVCLMIIFASLLSACCSSCPKTPTCKIDHPVKEYDATPWECRGVSCSNTGVYQHSSEAVKDSLQGQGATVVVLGDQILIVIPSSQLFRSGTSTIKPPGYKILSTTVQYINRFNTMLVKVAAYTNDTGSECVDLELSHQQAKNVAKVLLGYGIDARVLFSEGYGGTHLVAKNSLDWDHSANYRIEITLEKLYV